MLTDFGKLLRKIRMDREELLYNMAQKLRMTPAQLSAIETGKCPIPDGFVEEVVRVYDHDLQDWDIASLQEASAEKEWKPTMAQIITIKVEINPESDDWRWIVQSALHDMPINGMRVLNVNDGMAWPSGLLGANDVKYRESLEDMVAEVEQRIVQGLAFHGRSEK